MKILLLSLFLFFPAISVAVKKAEKDTDLSFGFAAGVETAAVNGGDGYMQSQNLDVLSVMVGWDNKWVLFEKAQFNLQTGNASLNVSSENYLYSLWMTIEQDQISNLFIPYFNMGLGYATSTVKTTVLGDSETDQTDPKFSAGAGLGLRLKVPYAWLSLEGRVLMIDGWDPAPTVGAVAKLGFYF